MSESKKNFLTLGAATASCAEAGGAERGRMHALLGRRSVTRVLPWRRWRLRGGLCALGAAAALALLLTLPAAPARAECGTTVEQGTYDPDTDTFTPGTAATDTDIRFECTESDTDDNSYISFESLPEDAIPDDLGPGSYVVVDLKGTDNFLPSTDIDPYWVFRSGGIETTLPGWPGDGIGFYNQAGTSLRVEVRAPITTRGDGARGVFMWVTGGGSATVINRGTINTHGGVDTSSFFDQAALGIQPASETGAASGTNYGRIETRGNAASGIEASAGTDGASTATNYGTVIVRGGVHLQVIPSDGDPSTVGRPTAARAISAFSGGGGNAHAVNMAGATAEARGQAGTGVSASAREAGDATAENFGSVATSGDHYEVTDSNSSFHGSLRHPEGVAANAHGAGEARAINHAGGMIETTGTGGVGLVARGLGTGDATATNRGTIIARGDRVVSEVPGNWVPVAGVQAQSEQSDATVVNSGAVTVTGAGASGLQAIASGSGTATVEMTGGTVVASAVDDPDTADAYENGVGISAQAGTAGTASVTVSGNATVTAPSAAQLFGGTTSLLVNNGELAGNVQFGDGTNTLETRGFGLIDGDIFFGEGEDTLILNATEDVGVSSITGDVTGLETMIKRGLGIARVNNVTFTGSSLTIEEGSLNVRGHVDLGADGTVTVEDAGRLTMEIGDVGNDADDHGRVTAGGGVTLEGGEPAVFAAYDPALTDAQRASARGHLQTQGIGAFSEGTEVTASSGADVTLRTATETGAEPVVGTITDGTALLDEGMDLGQEPMPMEPEEPMEPDEPMEPEEPAAHDGDSGTDGAGVVLGSALGLAFLLFDIFPDEDEESAGSFVPGQTVLAWSDAVDAGDTGTRYWVHALTDETPAAAGTVGSLQGLRMGFTSQLGDGFHLGLSGMPQRHAALGDDAVDGHRYALRGGWSTDDAFASVSLSRGDYQARTAFSNLDGLGMLSGTFGLRHDRAQAEVGTHLGFGGVSLDPTLSLYAGTLDRDAYTADSGALRSEIPAFTQRYEGWKAGVSLSPQEWLGSGPVRWLPELSLATARTSTEGPGALSVRQADRAGALSFTTPARAEALPQTVHALGTAVSIAKSEDWKLRGGYVAMMADGELVHAAVARFKLRF